MRILWRKTLRDLWQIRGRALVVALTVAAGVGTYAGIGMAIATGFHTRAVLLDRMRFADLEVQFLPEDVANLPDLTRVPGVRVVERRLVLPGTVSLADHRRINGILVFLETAAPTLDVLELTAGRPLRAGDIEGAVIERSLHLFHDFRVGDRIRVQVGAKVYESRIDGVAVSPEYLITAANPDYVVPEKGALGVVFTSLDRVSDALGFTMVNDLLFRFEPGADRGAVRDAVVERVARLNLERVIPREEHYVWRYLQASSEAFEVYVPALILTLGILSLVLTLITVNRLVLAQRREIGALLALGYSRGQVARAYLGVGMLLGAAGGVIGTGLAFVLRDLFAGTFTRAVGMPEYITVVLPGRLAIGVTAAVAGTAVAAVLPAWRLLRLPPQVIVREPVREGMRLRGLFALTGGLPLPVRFGLRNTMRRPGRALSTILAIGFSLSVAIAYMVSLTSALQTPEMLFARDRWDLAADFLYPVHLDDVEPIQARPGVTAVEPYFRRFAEVGVAGRYEAAAILGIRPGSGMRQPSLRAGRVLSGRPDEVVVSQDLSQRLGLSVGDAVTIRIRRGRELAFRVVGVGDDGTPAQLMIPLDQAQTITDFDGMATGVYLAARGAPADVAAAVGAIDYVAKVTTKAGVAAALRKLMSDMLGIVYLASGVSVSVALLFIFMSVSFVVSERQAEYATLTCLGYRRRWLGATILTQALTEGGLAAAASVPLGIALAIWLNTRMSQAWYGVLTIVRPGDVVQVLAVALALIPLAAYPGVRALDRLNIADALGARLME